MKIPPKDWSHLRPGDVAIRMLAGKIPLSVKVQKVTDERIFVFGGWQFLRRTGAEVDEDLGWDGIHATGSFLTEADDVATTVGAGD